MGWHPPLTERLLETAQRIDLTIIESWVLPLQVHSSLGIPHFDLALLTSLAVILNTCVYS